MIKEVIKRNGKTAKFVGNKIRCAIEKANAEVPELERATEDEIDKIVKDIKYIKMSCVHIETIQNMVEISLMKLKHFELAKKYIIYRYTRNLGRELSEAELSVLGIIKGDNDDVLEENSNKHGYTNSTQRDLMAGEVSKTLAKKVLLPPDILETIYARIYHWHDMDYTAQNMINCCLIDIKGILDFGTVLNGLLIESPHSFRVACNIMTQVIANIASNQYGGQSVAIKHLGKYLAISRERTRIKFSKMWDNAGMKYTEKQLNQVVEEQLKFELEEGIQTIQYQINTLMTTNGQAPFLTIFMHIDETSPYKNEIAMIVEEIIRQRHQGVKNKDGHYITPAFPKLIYVLDENNCLDPEHPAEFDYITEMAAKCTIKRSYPDYISAKKMREEYDGEVFSCMGCRSFLSAWKKTEWYVKMMGEPEEEIGKYKWEGRFNQGVVTLNLPQIAIIADGDFDVFWQLLDERLAKCYRALLYRHKLLEDTLTDTSPLHWQFGGISRLKSEENINQLLHDGYSTISLGYIGIYETVYAMLGVSHTTPEGEKLALQIMNRLRQAVDMWKEQTGLGFGLYGTPAESLCYKFCKHDAEKYGLIPNVTDKGYYTNSYHVDVREEINAFEKFEFEAQFQPISSGGCISYCEIPNLDKNLPVVKKLIFFIYNTLKYAEFNSKSDYCFKCGYDGQIDLNDDNNWECPCCHNTNMKYMSISRRTCGYLGQDEWNWGKRKEMGNRREHL